MNKQDQMKIVFIIGQLERGGAETQLYYLLQSLPHTATIVSLSSGGYWAKPIRELGHTVIELERQGRFEWKRLSRLRQILRETQPDVVHIFLDGVSGLYGRLAAMMIRPQKLLVGVRSHPTYFPTWYLRLMPMLNRFVDYVVCNSSSSSEYMKIHQLASPNKLKTITNGLDLARFSQPVLDGWQNPLPTDWQDKPIIGTVGHLKHVKGSDIFIETAVQVHDTIPDARFVYIGEGPMRLEIEALIKHHNAADYILLLGERNDVPQLLSELKIFMLPSRSEGLSNALMEALAASLPSVITDTGDSADYVKDSHAGFVSPVEDVMGLALHVVKLLRDPDLYAQCRENAIQYAESFSNHGMTQAYLDLYES